MVRRPKHVTNWPQIHPGGCHMGSQCQLWVARPIFNRFRCFGGPIDPCAHTWLVKRVSPRIDDVFLLFSRCVSSSFLMISNLHTNIHQHFMEFVSNNSYHKCWRSSFMRSCRIWRSYLIHGRLAGVLWWSGFVACSLEHVLPTFLPKFRYSNISKRKHGIGPFGVKCAGMRFEFSWFLAQNDT